VIFWNLSYGPPWTFPKTIFIIWSSFDISWDNSKNNYLIFKPHYFIFPLNLHLITTTPIFPTHQHGYEKNLTCVFWCSWKCKLI
jgi:hypothetical protein